ncbi:MAG: glycosyltransferase family 4 protein [Spirochaetota bacterium]
MLAPISWPVPPEGYGPWEQVVYNLTEQLVHRGIEVSLFAAPGSRTSAQLVETVPHPFSLWPKSELQRNTRLDPSSGLMEGPPNFRALEQLHIAACMEAAHSGQFDMVHSHLHIHALVFSRLVPCPVLTTLHGSAWVRAHHPVLEKYKDMPFASISNAERAFKPDLNYVATVYNGINTALYCFEQKKENYLLFSGRLSPEKGAHEAVQIARKAGMPLKLAGMIENQYLEYYKHKIEPYIDGKNIEYTGLLSQKQMVPLYQKAKALVCPTLWDEPFGLVGVEAQACGTPVLGRRKGALKELVQEGKTGFLFDDVEEAAGQVKQLDEIAPELCRKNVEERFSSEKMAQGYLGVYEKLINKQKHH